MTREELLEALLVERYLPLPPVPKPGLAMEEDARMPHIPEDTALTQYARRRALLDADPATLVQRRGIWVADRSAA